MSQSKQLYRVSFVNQGEVYEVYAKSISHGGLLGFVELEQLVFGEKTALVVDPGVPEMVTLFNVSGALLYCDENGGVTHAEDVFDKLAMAKAHYERVGLGAGYVDKFVR